MSLFPHNFKEKVTYALSMWLSRIINARKDLRSYTFTNILVIKLDEIGDLCYSLHVFDLLKERYPGARVTLLCRPYCVSLVQSHPSIDKVLTVMPKSNEQFDLIVDLRGNFQTIWYALLNRPQVRLDRGTVRYRNKLKGGHPHEVITNLQVIQPLLFNVPEIPKPRIVVSADHIEAAQQYLDRHNIKKFAVIHAGARRILRRWPPTQFAALARWLKEAHQFDIIFTGDINDKGLVDSIQDQLPFEIYNSCGQFDLTGFAAQVQKAGLYVGNESGPLCIASVSGAPSLGLFGPGEPVVFYPYGRRTAYIHHVLECNPCDQVHCVHPDNPCIQRITMLEVKAKVGELLM